MQNNFDRGKKWLLNGEGFTIKGLFYYIELPFHGAKILLWIMAHDSWVNQH